MGNGGQQHKRYCMDKQSADKRPGVADPVRHPPAESGTDQGRDPEGKQGGAYFPFG
ncbi:hypothetical protein D3C73_1495950 [compost metagenome]